MCLLERPSPAFQVVSKLADPVVDFVVRKVVHHAGYIVRYKENMKKLEDEKKNLEMQMGENEEKVKEAEIRNDIVDDKLLEWAEEAETIKLKVNLWMGEAGDKKIKCFKFYCPNIRSRYRMSKQAEYMKLELEGHIRKGNFSVVSRRRPPPPELQVTLSSHKFMDFDSRKILLEKIKDRLANAKVNMVGVYGAGGVGKTTAVEEVCKQLKKDGIFYEIVKGVVSRQVNVREIQDQLADQLHLEFETKTEKERAGELYIRLNNKKDSLVMLDDLWQELDLRAIGIPLEYGNKHCKVILTTRDLNVLMSMSVGECIQFGALTKDEAWALFEKNMGVTLASDELLTLAKYICQECGGLPVAILAVGGALRGKEEIRIWRSALKQLQNSYWEGVVGIDRKMYNSLKLSYDYLKQEDKPQPTILQSILLSCSLYPEDADIPVDLLLFHCIARRLLEPINVTVDEARDQIFTLVDSLKARSLLLDGKDGNYVKMHDVIRDIVLSIGRSDEQYLVKDAIDEWPAEYINENLAAVSIYFNKLKEVPNELVCPRLHTLRFESTDSSFQFPDNFFCGAWGLRILQLKGICMLSIPPSLANLSKLRTIILVNCLLADMSFLKGLKSNLEVLVIVDSYIKSLPAELGEQSHLRVLILDRIYAFEVIPAGVISKLTHLEELHFPADFDASEETLSEVSSLTRLTSLSIFIRYDTPVLEDHLFDNLVSYQLAVGAYTSFEPYSKRKTIKLIDTSYNYIFAKLVERAESVHLCGVKGLKFLLTSSYAIGFQRLRELHIEDCEMLEGIIGTEGEIDELDKSSHLVLCFSKLKVLHLEKLPKLRSFRPRVENSTTTEGVSSPEGLPLFGEKAEFPVLERLTVNNCSNITQLWHEQVLPTDSFPQLALVNVLNCDKLVYVFPSNMLTKGPNLKNIDVSSCEGVKFIVSVTQVEQSDTRNCQTIIFPYLHEVQLSDLKNLKSFCDYSTASEQQPLFEPQVIFLALDYIELDHLENITEIWDKQVLPEISFPQLLNVYVQYCHKLVNIFPSSSWAQWLQGISICNCKGVQVVFSITEEEEEANNCSIIFPHLHHISLSDMEKLECFCGNSITSKLLYLFGPQVIFLALEYLDISSFENITEIWANKLVPETSFAQPLNVTVEDCNKLVNIFSSYSWSQSLKTVHIEDCKGVQVIFPIIEQEQAERYDTYTWPVIFPLLRSVSLSNLENFVCFCGEPTRFGKPFVFSPKVQFPALEAIKLMGIDNANDLLGQVITREVIFPSLRRLEYNSNSWTIDWIRSKWKRVKWQEERKQKRDISMIY